MYSSFVKLSGPWVHYQMDGQIDASASHFSHLSGMQMQTYAELHEEFATKLNFPAYFGRNWDALHDCLLDLDSTGQAGPYVIIIDQAEMVLAKENDRQMECLIQILDSAGSEWSIPISRGDQWDRPGIPFHVVFVLSSGGAPHFLKRIEGCKPLVTQLPPQFSLN